MLKAKDNFSYTTLEVILIIILIAVWLGVVLPRFGAGDLLNKSRLRTTVFILGSDMRSARNTAITKSVTYTVQFNYSNKEYQIIAPGGGVVETKAIPAQVAWTGVGQLGFNSLGSATFSGSRVWTLSSGGDQYTITVFSPTGTARIQKQ